MLSRDDAGNFREHRHVNLSNDCTRIDHEAGEMNYGGSLKVEDR
jgi:hypothetical protein